MQVVLFSDIENKLIKIKKPVSVGLGNFRLNISYLSNDLLIQTPTLYNPFEVSRFDSIDLLINSPGISESFDSKISYINKLDSSVWAYLKIRMETGLHQYMVQSMLNHAKEHKLASKMSSKWDFATDEIENNLEDLAKYVADGIVELII